MLMEAVLLNPKPARGRSGRFKKKRKTARRKPAKRRTRTITVTKRAAPRRRRKSVKRKSRARPNPVGFNLDRFLKTSVMPSAIGAAGALALDVVMNKLPIDEATKAGPMRPLIKGVGAVGIGMLANMVTTRRNAEQITAGALTVAMYDAAKTFLSTQFPALGLSGADYPLVDVDDAYPQIEYLSPNQLVNGYDDPLGEYLDEGVGGYDDSLGEYLDDGVYL